MNKEDILEQSRQENWGKPDELEVTALGKAARMGMLVGGVICLVLFELSTMIWNRPDIASAAWMIYLAMIGSNNLVLYKHLKQESKLLLGILCLAGALFFMVSFIVLVSHEGS